jgi:hypothetical protein
LLKRKRKQSQAKQLFQDEEKQAAIEKYFKHRFGYKVSLFPRQFLSLLLLYFFLTFFLSIDNSTALQTIRSLYNVIEPRTLGNFLLLSFLSIFVFP